MKILINGGGIAGNALAFWLSKLGHIVTVVERFPTLRASGLQVDLRGHGIEVMKRMGIEQAFRSKIVPEQGIQVVDKSGKQRAFFPVNKSGKGSQNFTTEYEIMRGEFCRILYDASKTRVKYIFNKAVESFEETKNEVQVRYTDTCVEQFDLLVGADGQYSHIRRLMLGLNKPDAIYPLKDLYVAYFTCPLEKQENEEYIATSFFAPGRRGIMTRRNNPHELQVYIGCTTEMEKLENARRGDVKVEKEALAEIFEGAGWRTKELVAAMMGADDFYCERMGLVKLDSWSKGRVAVVGDAAYCPTANTGMGTTSAMVGAYILAGEIGRHCGDRRTTAGDNMKDLQAALKGYEEKFRPFMDQVQKGVSEGMNWPSNAFSIAVMNGLLGVASFFKVNMGKWMLREDVKGWDLPDYVELK